MTDQPAPGPSTLELLPLPEIAEALDEGIVRVEQRVKDGELLVVRNAAGVRAIPALFVQDGAVVKHLAAVIRLLRDARFTDDEAVAWLHRSDDSLPGSPIEALRGDRSREVKRRAQAEL